MLAPAIAATPVDIPSPLPPGKQLPALERVRGRGAVGSRTGSDASKSSPPLTASMLSSGNDHKAPVADDDHDGSGGSLSALLGDLKSSGTDGRLDHRWAVV